MGKIRNVAGILICIIIMMLIINGCSEEFLTQSDPDQDFVVSKKDKTVRTLDQALVVGENPVYPQSGSGTAYYWSNKSTYRGTGFSLSNGSSFDLSNGALTAPENWPEGENITITMKVEKDPVNNQLTFTFGPSGCSFDPPVEIWFSWQDIGVPVPNLYYIDQNGELIEEMPDNIDVYEKKMCLYINHFSRYSVAYSD